MKREPGPIKLSEPKEIGVFDKRAELGAILLKMLIQRQPNKFRFIALMTMVSVGISGCASRPRATDPSSSPAWLSVYYRYPFHGPKADFSGRPGPGFELYPVDERSSLALAVIFPNGGKPISKYLQNENYFRFLQEWERIGILQYGEESFEQAYVQTKGDHGEEVTLVPHDARSLVITLREKGKEKTLEIYAPEFRAEALKDKAEGKALHDCMDLLHRVVGELIL